MKRNFKYVLCIVSALALAITALASANHGKKGGDGPLPQAQAQAAITAGSASDGVSTQSVSPAVVAAAAAQPGVVTLGTAPASDGTVPDAAAIAPMAADYVSCWAVNSGWTWGTWPYNQHINAQTYWCAHYNAGITSISLSPSASSQLCDSSASGGVVGGGIGNRYFVEEARGAWSCPTDIPWVNIHSNHYLQTAHNSIGSSSQVGAG